MLRVLLGIVCAGVVIAVPFVVPERAGWLVFGGAIFGIAVLSIISLFLWGYITPGASMGPIGRIGRIGPARRVLDFLIQVVLFWIAMVALAALFLLPFPLIAFNTRSAVLFFLAGTFVGTVVHIALIHLWQAWQRSRYEH